MTNTVDERIQVLEQRLQEVEGTLSRLAEIDAVKRVQEAYVLASDDPDHIVDRMLQLVAEDVELDIGEDFGKVNGRDGFRAILEGRKFPWTFHYMIPHHVEVSHDHQTASGTWYLWELATMPNAQTGDLEAVWIAASYDNEFAKKGGVWKITKLKFNTQLISPYADGWVKNRFCELPA